MAITKKPAALINPLVKNKLITALLLFCLCHHAQTNFGWYPVQPGIQYNYRSDTSTSAISTVIKIDSAAGNTFFLNNVVMPCDTCRNARLLNDYFDSTYTLNQQAQFLGHGLIKTNTNTFYFYGPKRFVIKTHLGVGSTWLFDTLQGLTASIVAKYTQAVFGTSDSLCAIKLSTNDTLVLSKTYGILRFPFQTLVKHQYTLVGVEGNLSAGIKLKRFHDFFNFYPGDVLQYELLEDDFNTLPPMLSQGHERWDILSVNNYADSVVCRIRKSHYDSLKYGGSQPVITAFTQTQTLTFKDSLTHLANSWPFQEIFATPYFLFNNGIRYIHRSVPITYHQREGKQLGQGCPNIYLSAGVNGAAQETGIKHVFINRNASKIIGRSLVEGLGFTNELYNDYSRISQRCLIGYKKGSDSSGTIYQYGVTGLSNLKNTPALVIVYPNPVSNDLCLLNTQAGKKIICIYNATGTLVMQHEINGSSTPTAIDVRKLDAGIYTLIIDSETQRQCAKIIICR